ncbi:hypothetical protein CH273_14280 [Rhodococcus sp. 05-339-2]|uniref:hypothetical protein n=1 Tax=Rhodococcoides fascians TaxID=1828 RepID=UPI00068E3A50|nr:MULTISPECIES: hypothetical protein [Rhodococcus]OZD79384.1 hypothetical protein CH273_14280 [Rhodococcus sp. 05-339-2]
MLTAAATPHNRMAVLCEDAHIVAESPAGPRGDSPLTRAERNRYENLILLCNYHHQQIDSQPESFPVELLHQWKADHEEWVEAVLAGEAAPTALTAATPYVLLGQEKYLDIAAEASEQRRRQRRLGAGLEGAQVERSLTQHIAIPTGLQALAAGDSCVLVGPLGSGKSDMAEEWHRASLVTARKDSSAPAPVWLSSGSLNKTIEDFIVREIGAEALAAQGVDVVVDGLDEHTEDAATLLLESRSFVDRWPKSRVALTARAIDKGSPVREVAAPLLEVGHANRLMATVAGQQLPPLNDQLAEAARRPLFALLIARHASAAEGATGIPELVDRVVDDVVEREGFDLYAELRRLAVETIRDGKPIDPARFTTTQIAARIRGSSLVTRTGRTCGFSLATFEQWFAAKAIIEEEVDLDEELTSLETFDQWKYVLAIVLAASEPVRADAVMGKLVRWNPGAAAWVIKETHAGGLARTNPDYNSEDWARIGTRLRFAAEAWMGGLGPLALATTPAQFTGTVSLERIALAVDVQAWSLRISWLVRDELPGRPLDKVISLAGTSPFALDRSISMRTHAITTGPNWVWETMRDHLGADFGDRLGLVADRVATQHAGVLRDEFNDMVRSKIRSPKGESTSPTPSLYPAPDLPPYPGAPWGQYSPKTILARAEAVAAAAMRCYLELTALLAPNFGDTLGVRGLMPVEFYGDVHYTASDADDPDSWGPPEPGLAWLMRPISRHGTAPSDCSSIENAVSLTLNDKTRTTELRHNRDELYTWHKKRILDRPAYEPFAASFSTHFGNFDVLGDRPATALALGWLWADLVRLGWVKGMAPRFHR